MMMHDELPTKTKITPRIEDDGPAHVMLVLLLFGWWALPILLIPVIKNLWTKWRSKCS